MCFFRFSLQFELKMQKKRLHESFCTARNILILRFRVAIESYIANTKWQKKERKQLQTEQKRRKKPKTKWNWSKRRISGTQRKWGKTKNLSSAFHAHKFFLILFFSGRDSNWHLHRPQSKIELKGLKWVVLYFFSFASWFGNAYIGRNKRLLQTPRNQYIRAHTKWNQFSLNVFGMLSWCAIFVYWVYSFAVFTHFDRKHSYIQAVNYYKISRIEWVENGNCSNFHWLYFYSLSAFLLQIDWNIRWICVKLCTLRFIVFDEKIQDHVSNQVVSLDRVPTHCQLTRVLINVTCIWWDFSSWKTTNQKENSNFFDSFFRLYFSHSHHILTFCLNLHFLSFNL